MFGERDRIIKLSNWVRIRDFFDRPTHAPDLLAKLLMEELSNEKYIPVCRIPNCLVLSFFTIDRNRSSVTSESVKGRFSVESCRYFRFTTSS